MITLVELSTLFYGVIWGGLALRGLFAGEKSSILIPLVGLVCFFYLPLGFDHFFGFPNYEFKGFALAQTSVETRYVYCLYLWLVPPLWWFFGRRRLQYGPLNTLIRSEVMGILRSRRTLLYGLVGLPFFCLPFLPDVEAYFQYASFTFKSAEARESIKAQHQVVEITTFVSAVVAVILLTITPRRRWLPSMVLVFIVMVDCWLNGKRYIVGICAFIYLGSLWYGDRLSKTKAVLVSCGIVLFFAAYSFTYQLQRHKEETAVFDQYQNFRIDYGRDDVTKLTLYSLLHPERMQILEYPGQSLLFNATMFVPRSLWPDKPLPYAQYVTAAALGRQAGIYPGGFTTSWLEEALANFYWLGLLFGPFLFVVVCRFGDSAQNTMATVMTSLSAVLFLTVQLTAFLSLAVFWVLLTLWCKKIASQMRLVPHNHPS